MKVGQLREMLEDYDEDTEVRLAFQPSYPLQFKISGVKALDEVYEDDDEEEEQDEADKPKNVVYILQGDHPYNDSPYAKRALWD